MMSTTQNLLIAVVLGLGVLFFALKFGSIGGGGVGAERTKNPALYWLGVILTVVGVCVAVAVLISTLR